MQVRAERMPFSRAARWLRNINLIFYWSC
jgi:hypothetical protein